MKKRENIRDEFGISQEDLAVLLKINRSQIAMFETGKRDLPGAAMLKLYEMYLFAKEKASELPSTISLMNSQALQKKKALEHMVKENHYKQYALEKKLNVLEKKYNANLTAFQLINYYDKQDTTNYELGKEMGYCLGKIAFNKLEKNGLGLITKYQIEKEVLQAEEKIILQFLKNK
jgi:transcriptional regulator with XRE-family HTH domain